jgi:hypothetical protein
MSIHIVRTKEEGGRHRRKQAPAWAPAVTFAALCMFFSNGATPQTTTEGQTKAVVTATTAFLKSLNPSQREKVQFPFTRKKRAQPQGSREATRAEVPRC